MDESYVLLMQQDWGLIMVTKQDFDQYFNVKDNVARFKDDAFKDVEGMAAHFLNKDTFICSNTLDHVRSWIYKGECSLNVCAIYDFIY